MPKARRTPATTAFIPTDLNVKAIRTKINMTQEEFAGRFRIQHKSGYGRRAQFMATAMWRATRTSAVLRPASA